MGAFQWSGDGRRRRGWLAACLTLFVVAACSSRPPAAPPPPPEFSFEGEAPIALFVEGVEVIDGYNPPLAPPNVEHEFAAKPLDIVQAWAAQRIQPAGEGAVLQITMLTGSVVEETLTKERPGGVFGGLRRDLSDWPDRRYVGRLVVRAVYDGPYGEFVVDAVTQGEVDVNKKATLNTAESQYNDMLEAMAEQLDEALTRRIKEGMADLVLVI
ncbi:MAG: hypothetical protein AAGH48_01590 [Pseudomonadota bacterium]